MRYLNALMIIIILATMPSCKYFKGKLFGRKARQQAEMKARQDSIRVADSLKKIQLRLAAIEQERLDSVRIAEEAKAAQASRYNIVVGSFITPEYARAWAEEYRNRGYNPQIIQMANSRFELVVAESYETVGKAVKRLDQFQDTVQIDAWIYSKK